MSSCAGKDSRVSVKANCCGELHHTDEAKSFGDSGKDQWRRNAMMQNETKEN